jgi:hypothetical protein
MPSVFVSAQWKWAEARTVELARQNVEDTSDACIVSHQLRTTAFSTFVGFDWIMGIGVESMFVNSGG